MPCRVEEGPRPVQEWNPPQIVSPLEESLRRVGTQILGISKYLDGYEIGFAVSKTEICLSDIAFPRLQTVLEARGLRIRLEEFSFFDEPDSGRTMADPVTEIRLVIKRV